MCGPGSRGSAPCAGDGQYPVNSDRYKSWMQSNNELVAMRRAKGEQARLKKRLGKGNLSDKRRARLSDRLRRIH